MTMAANENVWLSVEGENVRVQLVQSCGEDSAARNRLAGTSRAFADRKAQPSENLLRERSACPSIGRSRECSGQLFDALFQLLLILLALFQSYYYSPHTTHCPLYCHPSCIPRRLSVDS